MNIENKIKPQFFNQMYGVKEDPRIINQEEKPIRCQIILTNKCNLNCSFCGTKKRNKRLYFDKKLLFKALKNLSEIGCQKIVFNGGGEPLLYPYFIDAVKQVKNTGMRVGLVTNGTLISKYSSSLWKNFDSINVSLNASRGNYKVVHGIDKYNDVIDGLKMLNKINNCKIGISYVFSEKSSIKDLKTLIKDIKNFSINHLSIQNDGLKPIINIKSKLLKSDFLNIPIYFDLDRKIPKHCLIYWYGPSIDCDGLVYPCCTYQIKRRMPMGHCSELKKIWEEHKYKVDTSKCLHCYHRAINNFLYKKKIEFKKDK